MGSILAPALLPTVSAQVPIPTSSEGPTVSVDEIMGEDPASSVVTEQVAASAEPEPAAPPRDEGPRQRWQFTKRSRSRNRAQVTSGTTEPRTRNDPRVKIPDRFR